jgi:3-oxoacyl-[acyl-carrier protein] reductase
MDLGLSGRPALVAAASRGMGFAAARSLAREGARVAICSRDRGAVESARDRIAEETGREVHALVADVAEAGDVERFVREGAEAAGGCQILVPNAGGPPPGSAAAAPDEDWLAGLELTFLSVARMCRAALPLMREAGYGRIVAISSLVVKQPEPSLAISNAVRLAVTGFLRTLAWEAARDGVTVNAVLPSSVLTDRHRDLAGRRADESGRTLDKQLAEDAAAVPVGRLGDPAEVGDLVAFLASERAAFLTGLQVQADGGLYRGTL